VRVADSRRQKRIVTLEGLSKEEGNRYKQDRQKRIFVESIAANISKHLVIPARVLRIASIFVVFVWIF
jgi:hypothetical protein